MKVTVTTLSDYIFVLDVSEDLELENFKAFCEVESGFPAPEIVIAFNGRPLMDDKKSLKDYGVKDGDAVILQHMLQSGAAAGLEQGKLYDFHLCSTISKKNCMSLLPINSSLPTRCLHAI